MSQRDEAVKVFEHFVGIGVKPNYTTYSLLVDAHLILRDPRAALAVVEEMVFFIPQPSSNLTFSFVTFFH